VASMGDPGRAALQSSFPLRACRAVAIWHQARGIVRGRLGPVRAGTSIPFKPRRRARPSARNRDSRTHRAAPIGPKAGAVSTIRTIGCFFASQTRSDSAPFLLLQQEVEMRVERGRPWLRARAQLLLPLLSMMDTVDVHARNVDATRANGSTAPASDSLRGLAILSLHRTFVESAARNPDRARAHAVQILEAWQMVHVAETAPAQ